MNQQIVKVLVAPKKVLTDTQYKVLLDLFNECNEDFHHLPADTLSAFYDRLYGVDKQATR
jgi:hypothetical protein